MQLWVQPDIQRPEQLQGKTLAITRFGSTSEFVTRLIMRKLDLEGKTELRQFGGVVEADMGFRARQAEGRVSSQAPGPGARMLVDAAELGIPFSMNLLAVSNDYYRKSPKSVEGIVAAYIEGIAALKTGKPQALKLLAKYMGHGAVQRRCIIEFVTKYLDAVPRSRSRRRGYRARNGRLFGSDENETVRQQHRRSFSATGISSTSSTKEESRERAQWRERLGAMVRDYIRSPELEHYFSIKMTKPRAAIMVMQQSLYVRHRRDCWAHVSANCPVLAVKQKILEHEYEEIIRDDFSEYGHLHLIIRQGKSVGLEPDEILNAQPLPETGTVLYAWSWMTSEMSWTEALAGMTITEWCNDDRLLGDLGGGQSTRMAKKWMAEMGFSWKQIPNLEAHSRPTKNIAICFAVSHGVCDGRERAPRDPGGQGFACVQRDVP